MAKTCFVFNMAPIYVQASYLLFDRELNVEWYFGSNDTNIKEMDHALLKKVKVFQTQKKFGNWYYIKGVSEVAKDKEVANYVLIGDPFCISMWTLPLKIKLHNPKAKIFFWSHGWYGKETAVKKILKKYFFKLADDLLLYGNYARELMIKEGFKDETLHTIHNSLDHDTQVLLRKNITPSSLYKDHFGNAHPILLFIGRLTPIKQLDMILEAVDILNKSEQYYNVVYVGDGPERKILEIKTKVLGLHNQVWFYGACYDEKTNAELIYNADLCVAPGNIGLTAMHVLVFGTPVLTHNDFKWQMPEFEAIQDGVTGCFFERNNINSLADAISKWFSEKSDKREEVRLECYKEIDENWTPEFELNVLKQVLI